MKVKPVLLLVFLFFVFNDFSFSLPRFALRLNDKCVDCHFNPTGGMIRNDDGWNFGKFVMSMISPRQDEFSMTPKIGDNITLGFDYRTQFLYSSEKSKYDFQQMTGSIYTNIGLASNINVLARYDFINYIWEAYGVLHVLPNNGYLKVGSFQPYFGIRLDDHTAYTRGGDFTTLFSNGASPGLIYNPLYTEVGVETGLYISDWAFFTASLGAGGNYATTDPEYHRYPFTNKPTVTTRLELTPHIGKVGLLMGGSFASVKYPVSANIYGFFAGFGSQRYSVMGEFDMSKDLFATDQKSNFVMAEASYTIILGLDAVVRYDRLDPNTAVDKDELQRVIFGFEFFPYSFIELRPQYRLMIEEPSINNDSFVLQFHFWY